MSRQAASWDMKDYPMQQKKQYDKCKQVLDVQVSKGITTAQSNEHLRNRSEKAAEYAMKKGNYDPTREHLNFEIVNGKVRPVDKAGVFRIGWPTVSVSGVLRTRTKDWWNPSTGRWSTLSSAAPAN